VYHLAYEDLKQSVATRYKHLKEVEFRESQQQKLVELTEKLNATKDKKAISILTKELKALPSFSAIPDLSDASSLESIHNCAQELHRLLREREDQLLAEDELEASMLCEVDRLSLLTLLRVFEVGVDLGVGVGVDDHSKGSEDPEALSRLSEQLVRLESALVAKVGRWFVCL
jgi:hypothetical protein